MLWYPYEQMKTMSPPYEIVDAEGVYLYTKDQKLIDSVSSWWSVIHGYKNPVLDRALVDQVGKFSHVMLGGLSHAPARDLADKLASWLPGDLDCCFFSDSGSVAVEVALKMALQYYLNQGQTGRTDILALEHAYHGDTFKTMAAGGRPGLPLRLAGLWPRSPRPPHPHGDCRPGGSLSAVPCNPQLPDCGTAAPRGRGDADV